MSGMGSVGPEDREREGDGVEGRDAHFLVVLEGRERGSRRRGQGEGFERAGNGVDEPEDVGRRPRRRCGVCRSGRRPCARAQDLADPVGGKVEPRNHRVASACARGASRRDPGRGHLPPRCSSGSSRIHQPPGPSRPLSNGPPIRTPRSSWRGHGARRDADAGAGRPRSARRPCSRGRRGRPGRWRGGGPWGRAGSWRKFSAP